MKEVTKFLMTDETGQQLVEKMHTQNMLLNVLAGQSMEGTNSLEEIAKIVRCGNASKVFGIGDQIIVPYTASNGTVYEFTWNITEFGDVTLADGETVPGMRLEAAYATVESIQFDAPEPDNADGNIQKYGYNRYSQSAIRQWLNSGKEKGQWWSAQSETDVAPSQLESINGFMRGFQKDFLDCLKPVKVQVATNTVTDGGVTDTIYDTFFLPSLEEVYGKPQAEGVEGSAELYWKRRLGITSPAEYHPTTYDGYKIFALENKTSAQNCWLRSASRGYSYNTWNVGSGGYLYGYNAYNSFRCAPACVIC